MSAPPVEKTRTVTVRSSAIRESKETEKDDSGKEIEIDVMRIDRVEANAGETIRWEAPADHAISIWFPHAGVFFTPVIAVMHEGPIEATIRDDAPDGTYEYAIYDHAEHRFVVCQSHPKLVIPKP